MSLTTTLSALAQSDGGFKACFLKTVALRAFSQVCSCSARVREFEQCGGFLDRVAPQINADRVAQAGDFLGQNRLRSSEPLLVQQVNRPFQLKQLEIGSRPSQWHLASSIRSEGVARCRPQRQLPQTSRSNTFSGARVTECPGMKTGDPLERTQLTRTVLSAAVMR